MTVTGFLLFRPDGEPRSVGGDFHPRQVFGRGSHFRRRESSWPCTGIWEGRSGNMGPAAVLRIGSIELLIASNATHDWNDERFHAVGMEARRAKFIVVKNPMNYRMAYGDFATGAFVLDTPGPTPATLKRTRFTRLKRPYFPAGDDIPDPKATVYRSNRR